MSTGLAASSVTPGSTAPDESRTVPVMDAPAWANAAQGSATTSAHAQSIAFSPLMDPPQWPRYPRSDARNLRLRLISVQYIFHTSAMLIWYRIRPSHGLQAHPSVHCGR